VTRIYFHRMGHAVCETCNWTGSGRAALVIHLEQHVKQGDPVPNGMLERFRVDMNASWSLAIKEDKWSSPSKRYNFSWNFWLRKWLWSPQASFLTALLPVVPAIIQSTVHSRRNFQ